MKTNCPTFSIVFSFLICNFLAAFQAGTAQTKALETVAPGTVTQGFLAPGTVAPGTVAPGTVAQANADSLSNQSSEATIAPAPAPSFRRAATGATQSAEASQPSASLKAEPSEAPSNFVPFTDKMQKAFSLMVPEAYRVKGGMYQYGPNDHRANLHISAPDDSVTLLMGDNKLSPYAIPDPKLTKHGFKDEVYEIRSGMKMLVKPYQPAPSFLTEYGLERLRRNYENVFCDGVGDQPALASGIFTIYRQGPAPPGKQEFTAADAHYHLSNHGKPMVAYLILVVETIYGYGPGMWKIPYVWGYVSTPEEETRAKQYLAQTMSSLQMTPEWIDKTSNKNRVVGLIMMQSTHAMATTANATANAPTAVNTTP